MVKRSHLRIRRNSGLLLVLIAGVVPLAAQGGAEDNLRRGLDAYQQSEYEKAIRFLSPIVADGEATQRSRDAIAALGLSYYFRNNYEKAAPLLEQASDWEPENVEFSYALAITHLHRRDVPRARRAFSRMFKLPADSPRTRLLAAKFLIREQMEDLAQTELEQAARDDPTLADLHFMLGQLAIFRGKMDVAIQELREEISLHPTHSMAYYRLGDAYGRKEMWNPAIEALKKAIWLNPDFSSPYILLGKVYLRTKQWESAEGMLKQAVSMDPKNRSARYLLGNLYRQTGRGDEARQHFHIWRELGAKAP